jgi:hypothetical protein
VASVDISTINEVVRMCFRGLSALTSLISRGLVTGGLAHVCTLAVSILTKAELSQCDG